MEKRKGLGMEEPTSLKATKRVKIPTGFKCNAQCKYCYYIDRLDMENPSKEYVKTLLAYAKEHGIRDVDFSGGESTIRGDLPDLISSARKLGFRNRCVITNGIRLANGEYMEELVNAGLNEILFSIEGSRAEIHDSLTRVPGSFNKVVESIRNAKKLGIRFRTNTTVTKENVKDLPELAKFLREIRPAAVNFIKFNPWSDAAPHIEKLGARYGEVAKYAKRAIDLLEGVIGLVNVRYIPFCFMEGYEKHVCNFSQLKYDPDEWLPWLRLRLEKGLGFKESLDYWLSTFTGAIKYLPFGDIETFSLDELLNGVVKEFDQEWYRKGETCEGCKYYPI
ncbi:hypothetical protein AKJ64_04835, partial [candidate division MSBL1 archaeon SCGC-AAA259E17]